MRFPLAFLMVVVSSVSLLAEENAPFGLSWGMSVDSIRGGLGSVSERDVLWGRVFSFNSDKLPSTPTNTDFFSLLVDPKYGLGKITWFSKDFTNDAFGSVGKEEYSRLKTILTEKYGPPTREMERTGLTLFDEPDEFYECLDYQGCGIWATTWAHKDSVGSIAIQLDGLSRGTGFLRVVYEGPNWPDILSAIERGENALDKDSF